MITLSAYQATYSLYPARREWYVYHYLSLQSVSRVVLSSIDRDHVKTNFNIKALPETTFW